MKFTLLSLIVFVLTFAPQSQAEQGSLSDIIKSEHRAESSVRDKYRNPEQTLAFFEIKNDQKVLEIWPGPGGWYTEILAPYLKDKGQLVLGHYNKDTTSDYYRKNYVKLIDKLTASPDLYNKVVMATFEPPGAYDIGEQGSYDRIITFRNLHNWTRHGDKEMSKIFALFFDALKPGGKLGVLDHRLPEDRDKNAQGGYVKQSYVIKLAEAAGFSLEDSSEINANPKDTADYEKGVWTLPPSLRAGDKNRDQYLAIGESDRMTLRFVKPE